MAQFKNPELNELLWTIAAARLILPASINIQAPPNLNRGVLPKLIAAGINDWGGVSKRYTRSRKIGSSLATSEQVSR